MKQITGWHVFGIFALGFGVIIGVNLTLAVNAVRSFPGLEVKNSYIASQSFDQDRAAQEALGWEVTADLVAAAQPGGKDRLVLRFVQDGAPVRPQIQNAIFGRPTSVTDDQQPEFVFDGKGFVAPVVAGPGNWNLRLVAVAQDGTVFQRRIVLRGGV